MVIRRRGRENLTSVGRLAEGEFFILNNRLYLITDKENLCAYCFNTENFCSYFSKYDEDFNDGDSTVVEPISGKNIEIILN